jgi:hypothetical protein
LIYKIPRPRATMLARYIVALSLTSTLCVFVVMALVTRFLVHKHSKPTTDSDASDASEHVSKQQDQLTTISRSWKHFFASKQQNNKGDWVPSLTALIDAGNEGLWSSALFTRLHGHPGEISFDQLCDAFATELRSRSPAQRSTYSVDVTKFLSSRKRSATGPTRVQSLSRKGSAHARDVAASKPQRRSMDVIATDLGLGRGLSVKKAAPALVSMGNGLDECKQGIWMKSGRTAQYYDGKPGVKVTPAELAALAIVLGCQLTTDADATPHKGAFGISVSLTQAENSRQHVVLKQHRRNISQMPTSGTGISPLFAMHMAAGSLPFSQDTKTIESLLITDATFEAIQTGASISWQNGSQQTPQSKFLTTLPNSRKHNFYTHTASSRITSPPTLIDAIAALPFSGGLPPLAHAPLIRTINFIAAGGLTPARLLQRLEGLVDKVHLHAPHLAIFGPLHAPQNAGLLFREHERLGKLATNPNTPDSTADKAARMQRYITLLERLMALVPDTKPQEVRDAVQQATQRLLQRSYADAVAPYTASPALTSHPPSHTPDSSMRSKRYSGTGTFRTSTSASHRMSASFAPLNLGTHAELLLKAELPLGVEGIAEVARLVIVAWTLSVERTAWDGEGESGGVRVWDAAGCKGDIVFA